VTHRLSLLTLVLMALLFGLGDALFFPASIAITPELVPGDELVGASALNGTSTQLARVLIGPALRHRGRPDRSDHDDPAPARGSRPNAR
jgi:MFS family permease